MIYGITGNIKKTELWPALVELIAGFRTESIRFVLDAPVAQGLRERGLYPETEQLAESANLPNASDVILSFGGDGTLLNTAFQIGARQTPILGVNMGRLGFLADTEVAQLQETIRRLERGEYRIESRMVLEARLDGVAGKDTHWALNDIVIEHSQTTQLISVEVKVDSAPLTTYWADGLIISTPTGSTAYSLSVGGPILSPGSGVVVLTPLAPHTLTVRPIVLPASATIDIRVPSQPYVFAADGRSKIIEDDSVHITIRQAQHSVKLIKMPEQDYFQTLRSKLRWSGK
ncbi:MAG: NAD(+)/NADH kinase [Rhodothermales bacterium]